MLYCQQSREKCSHLPQEHRETSSSWILLTFSRCWRHQIAYISWGRIESFPQHKIDMGTFLIVVVVLLLFTFLLQALHRTPHHSTVQSFYEDTAAQTRKSDEGERTEKKKVSEFSSPFISSPLFSLWCEKSFKFPSKCIFVWCWYCRLMDFYLSSLFFDFSARLVLSANTTQNFPTTYISHPTSCGRFTQYFIRFSVCLSSNSMKKMWNWIFLIWHKKKHVKVSKESIARSERLRKIEREKFFPMKFPSPILSEVTKKKLRTASVHSIAFNQSIAHREGRRIEAAVERRKFYSKKERKKVSCFFRGVVKVMNLIPLHFPSVSKAWETATDIVWARRSTKNSRRKFSSSLFFARRVVAAFPIAYTWRRCQCESDLLEKFIHTFFPLCARCPLLKCC